MKQHEDHCEDCVDFCEVTLAEIAYALERGEPWSEFWCALQATELRPGDRPEDLTANSSKRRRRRNNV